MIIREANDSDGPGVWRVIEPSIRAGETFALPADMTRADALAYWLSPAHEVFVAERDGEIIGTYYLRANQQGGGSHVANCGYTTAPAARGSGVARAMGLHSLERARARGFRAMQFNFVVSTNVQAVKLWRSLGFDVLGTLPAAFRHPTEGFVDAYVMYRGLA